MSTPIYLRKEIPHHPKSDHKITIGIIWGCIIIIPCIRTIEVFGFKIYTSLSHSSIYEEI